MSGRMSVQFRLGRSKDPRYSRYLEWYLVVEGEDGVRTTLSPSFKELFDVLRDVLIHELRNDVTRVRRPEFLRAIRSLLNVMTEAIHEFRNTPIPEIYHIANRRATEKDPQKERGLA